MRARPRSRRLMDTHDLPQKYQEGCRAYALKVISLLDQYKIAYRKSGAS